MEQMLAEYLNCTTEEIHADKRLSVKISAIRSLFSENKINSGNAFDLDITHNLHKWLQKNKRDGVPTSHTLFSDLSNYLDASAKIYSDRIDNVHKSISGVLTDVKRGTLLKNKDNLIPDECSALDQVKFKRPRSMLTTDDKLRRNHVDLCPKLNSIMDLSQLRKVANPSQFILSVLNNTTTEEDLKQNQENCKNKPDIGSKGYYTMPDVRDLLATGAICHEFAGFVAERDKTPNTTEDTIFECIEEHFVPEDNPIENYKWNSDRKETINDQHELDSKPNEHLSEEFNGLLACVDPGKSDYSFFNLHRLANWSGPKEWKATIMARNLRSRKPYKQLAIPSINDEETYESKKPKPNTKQSKKKPKGLEKLKVKWMESDELNLLFKIVTNQQILPHILRKWHSLNNAADLKSLKSEYKFPLLEFLEVEPGCIPQTDVAKQIDIEESCPKDLLSVDFQNIDCGNNEDMNENNYNDDDNIFQESNNEDEDEDGLRNETEINVAVLKLEILDIIHQECVFNPDDEQSTSISFKELLRKLKFSERDELSSAALVFVSLLHLSNEKCLKLTKNVFNDNGDETDVYISKPNEHKRIKF